MFVVILCFTTLLISGVLGRFALRNQDDYAIDQCRSCAITSGAGIIIAVGGYPGISWLVFFLTAYMLVKTIKKSF